MYKGYKEYRENYNKSRRIKIGLFKINSVIINANINGALNILRKYIKEIFWSKPRNNNGYWSRTTTYKKSVA